MLPPFVLPLLAVIGVLAIVVFLCFIAHGIMEEVARSTVHAMREHIKSLARIAAREVMEEDEKVRSKRSTSESRK